jgi:hypothetical protein
MESKFRGRNVKHKEIANTMAMELKNLSLFGK